jgi:hypothetical protein
MNRRHTKYKMVENHKYKMCIFLDVKYMPRSLINKGETNKVTISRDVMFLEEIAGKSIPNKSVDLEENKIDNRTKIEIDININSTTREKDEHVIKEEKLTTDTQSDTVRYNPKGLTKT